MYTIKKELHYVALSVTNKSVSGYATKNLYENKVNNMVVI